MRVESNKLFLIDKILLGKISCGIIPFSWVLQNRIGWNSWVCMEGTVGGHINYRYWVKVFNICHNVAMDIIINCQIRHSYNISLSI